MNNPTVKYETPPTLSLKLPECDSCLDEVETVDDGMKCPRCGTFWEYQDGDGDPGTLYEDWSGEENSGELRTHENGWLNAPGDHSSPGHPYSPKQSEVIREWQRKNE